MDIKEKKSHSLTSVEKKNHSDQSKYGSQSPIEKLDTTKFNEFLKEKGPLFDIAKQNTGPTLRPFNSLDHYYYDQTIKQEQLKDEQKAKIKTDIIDTVKTLTSAQADGLTAVNIQSVGLIPTNHVNWRPKLAQGFLSEVIQSAVKSKIEGDMPSLARKLIATTVAHISSTLFIQRCIKSFDFKGYLIDTATDITLHYTPKHTRLDTQNPKSYVKAYMCHTAYMATRSAQWGLMGAPFGPEVSIPTTIGGATKGFFEGRRMCYDNHSKPKKNQSKEALYELSSDGQKQQTNINEAPKSHPLIIQDINHQLDAADPFTHWHLPKESPKGLKERQIDSLKKALDNEKEKKWRQKNLTSTPPLSELDPFLKQLSENIKKLKELEEQEHPNAEPLSSDELNKEETKIDPAEETQNEEQNEDENKNDLKGTETCPSPPE